MTVQPLLRQAWSIALKYDGKENLLDRYTNLPLKGQVPDGASIEDAEYFKSFEHNSSNPKFQWKRFTIQVDFSGTSYPFYIYIPHGPNGYAETQYQFRWVGPNPTLLQPAAK
jgi:hypothetical protein